eukprot:scaffold2090_cov225-Prasinococcus_capsulatus_cf.AAC.24
MSWRRKWSSSSKARASCHSALQDCAAELSAPLYADKEDKTRHSLFAASERQRRRELTRAKYLGDLLASASRPSSCLERVAAGRAGSRATGRRYGQRSDGRGWTRAQARRQTACWRSSTRASSPSCARRVWGAQTTTSPASARRLSTAATRTLLRAGTWTRRTPRRASVPRPSSSSSSVSLCC